MNKEDLEKAIIDTLGEKLLGEFTELGETYPNFAALFIDLVSIVSQQNSQINTISQALQDIVVEINKMKESVKDLKDTGIFPQDTEKYLTNSIDNVNFIRASIPTKKEDLN